eukprot:g1043.t1
MAATTVLEKLDHVAGLGYAVQLMFMGESFMNDNFKNAVANDSAAYAMCRYSSLFIVGMRLHNYVFQTMKTNTATKKLNSLANAIVWGGCLALSLFFWDELKEPYVYVNVGLQLLFTGGYLRQYFGAGADKEA